jgi:uncharacterized phage protein (TIGR01671 family)
MREIKFRVWNKATKSWLNDDAGTHCWSEYCLNIFTGEVVEFVTSDNKFFSRANEPNFYFDKNTHVKESPYVVQQYTGLKDKNGVEIYEGDIIHYKFNGDSYPKEAVDRILTCSYDEDEGMYSFDDSDHSYYWAEIKRHSNIIGNIYENPELLKA